jgi:hypothetical protein
MISRRNLEFATALLTGTFGAAVAISSIDNGIRLTGSGVGAGTFPFAVGLIILAGSVINLVRGGFVADAVVLNAQGLRRWTAMFVPAAAFVAAIPLLGLYVACAIYVFASIAARKRWPLWRAALFAVAFAAAVYFVFEWLFQVSLPHGWLGDLIGW